MKFPVTINASMAYTQTPAQGHRLVTTLGASTEYSLMSKLHLYLNPKAVLLDHNSLVGIGVGASYEIAPKLSLMGDWTPLVSGSNTISTQSETSARVQIYSVGLRFSDLIQGGSLDLGVTNATGLTTGTSLTPSLGNSPALYARLSYRF